MTEPAVSNQSTSFIRRLIRAAALDSELYEEVEADTGAGVQAAAVVVLMAISVGVGSLENAGWIGVPVCAAAALVGWIGWSAITCFVGTRLLPTSETSSDMGELLRTIGFASAPGILACFGVIPGLNPWLFLILGTWLMAAMVVGVRQALDYSSTFRALAVCTIGFPLAGLVLAAALLVMGPWPI